MIDLDKIKKGDKVWRSCLEFARSHKRANKIIPPTEVIFEKSITYKWNTIGIASVKGNSGELYNCYVTELFETKEEADEHWNSIVYNALDYVQHEYETKQKYIKKFLTNYGRKN